MLPPITGNCQKQSLFLKSLHYATKLKTESYCPEKKRMPKISAQAVNLEKIWHVLTKQLSQTLIFCKLT